MFMSSMGLPLLNGFVGEFTILQGTFMENKWWAAWAAPGVILAAAYLLWLYQRVFFGKNENPKNAHLLDLSAREMATFVPLVILAFAIGLYPKPLFQILAVPVNNLVATVRPDYPGVTKPVVAGEPAKSAQPDATPLTEPQKVPEQTAPATAAPGATTSIKQDGPVKTAQLNPAAATAGGR
jgi:NADH-quinone oxidoreductase subunit M